jgi:hypothetical protein
MCYRFTLYVLREISKSPNVELTTWHLSNNVLKRTYVPAFFDSYQHKAICKTISLRLLASLKSGPTNQKKDGHLQQLPPKLHMSLDV